MKQKQRSMTYRIITYVLGLVILALGICLNTRTGLGTSPIVSVAYCNSIILDVNFGNATFAVYTSFVVIEMVLHVLIWRRAKKQGEQFLLGKSLVFDGLQLLVSLIFTRFMNLFAGLIPDMSGWMADRMVLSYTLRIGVLLVAVVLTGVGAAMSLEARIIPNPGDGIVQTISDFNGKKIGTIKNILDITCVTISVCEGLLLRHRLVGVGIGTVIAAIGVGRVVALYRKLVVEGPASEDRQ